jgi:hypothetical protein
MDDILKEAIADAKALRATALENAKIALEEAFTPRLKNMLSQKIQSEDLPDNEEYGEGEGEVGSGDGHMEAEDENEDPQERKHSGMHGEDEAEDGPEEAMYQSDVDDKEGEVEEAEHGDMEDAGMHDDEMEPDSLEKEEEEGDMEDAGMHDDDKDELDELDLESVIKELEEELDSSEVGDAENKEPSERANDSSEIGAQGPEGEGADEEGGKENSEDEVVKEPVTEAEHGDDKDELEEIDLEEVLQALSEEEGMEKEDEDDKKVDEMQTQLKEYKDTIGYLREKLNEVNLLNAKLLFTNKLFRSFGLNNNQKLSVVEQFDRTQNLREIKLVYATLAESFKGNGNKKVNESKGQASKAVASTEPKKEVLSEGAEMKNRFKKLANLI